MRIIEYDRKKVKEYAKKWAYQRNPAYYNYDAIGGDCTNFVSQCIFSGCKTMNYNKNGWYYNSANDKSPSWTGVEFLNNFLLNNKSVGPFAKLAKIQEIEIGDIIQLSFNGENFGHSLMIVEKLENNLDNIFVATHTFDSYGRRVSSYDYIKMRFLHIEGIRKW